MTRAIETEIRVLAAVVGALAQLGVTLLQTADAGARGAAPSPASTVRVVGSGTFARARVAVLASASAAAKRVAVLKQFRPDLRPQWVLAVDVVKGVTGSPAWYRINVPGRPNGWTGWVRAAALELRPVRKRIVVYRGERRFEFWDGDRPVRRGRVAVGKPGAETPTGLFHMTSKFDPRIDPDWSILGNFAFETSAYSKLTDSPGGGIVGMHGTPWPNLLGQAVSHGCVRLHNRDVEFLRSRIPLGTPIKIVR